MVGTAGDIVVVLGVRGIVPGSVAGVIKRETGGGGNRGRETEVLIEPARTGVLNDLDLAAVLDSVVRDLDVFRVRGEAGPGRPGLPHLLREAEAPVEAESLGQVDTE